MSTSVVGEDDYTDRLPTTGFGKRIEKALSHFSTAGITRMLITESDARDVIKSGLRGKRITFEILGQSGKAAVSLYRGYLYDDLVYSGVWCEDDTIRKEIARVLRFVDRLLKQT